MIAEHRKLATIMFTDMVGYSALTQKNEALALELLDEQRTLLRAIFPKHGGREIEAVGDGFFVEFASALEGARCAVEIQQALVSRNAAKARERWIQVRIGLHLGDVVVRDNRVHGDGVNIAARIEPLAEPGGICLSEDVARQVQNKLELPLVKLGKGELKNIQLPVEIYRVVLPWEGRHLPWSDRVRFALQRRRTRRFGAAAAVVLVLGVVGGLYVAQWTRPAKLALPDKPSIAVLPFTNMSGEPEQEYFVDGLTEDIITQLSHFRELFVIARNSTFQYKGKAVDVGEVGRKLGVRYVLEGSIRLAADRIRVTAQLIDVASGTHLWAHSYNEPLKDVFAVQDQVTQQIVGALGVSVRDVERERALRKVTEDLNAYELVLRAGQLWAEASPAEHLKVRTLAEQAVRRDPGYARAQALLAFAFLDEYRWKYNPHPDRPDPLASAFERAELAVRLDAADAYTHYALGKVACYARKLDRFEQEFRKAVTLNPNFADAKADFGIRLALIGRHDEGAALTREAIRLNPLYPGWYHFTFAIEAFQRDDFQRVLVETEKMALPQLWVTQEYLAVANAHLGRMKEARSAITNLLRVYPGITQDWEWQMDIHNYSPHFRTVMTEGLRKAGLFDAQGGE